MANKLRVKYGDTVVLDNLDLELAYTKKLLSNGKLFNKNITVESYTPDTSKYIIKAGVVQSGFTPLSGYRCWKNTTSQFSVSSASGYISLCLPVITAGRGNWGYYSFHIGDTGYTKCYAEIAHKDNFSYQYGTDDALHYSSSYEASGTSDYDWWVNMVYDNEEYYGKTSLSASQGSFTTETIGLDLVTGQDIYLGFVLANQSKAYYSSSANYIYIYNMWLK